MRSEPLARHEQPNRNTRETDRMIVITGGAGFIGSALIWGLNRRGVRDILAVDARGKSEGCPNVAHLDYTDYMDKDDFITQLEQGSLDNSVEGIIHMGACTDTTENDADFLMSNNYEYTKRLAEWSLKSKKRFVYASSAATYGDGNQGFSDDHDILSELQPLNMYARSKHLFDLWAMRHDYLGKIAGLKYFNVFGPNEYHKGEMRSVVHKAFEQIKASGKVKLFRSHRPDYQDGGQLRDFVYIKDIVDITIFIYNQPTAQGIINVGTGQARSFYDLVVAIFSAMNLTPDIEYIDMPESLRDQYQYLTQADVSKLRSLGYTNPTHPLEGAADDYVKNYLLNKCVYLSNERGCCDDRRIN